MSNKEWDLISYNQSRWFSHEDGCKTTIDYINWANERPNGTTEEYKPEEGTNANELNEK
jgi:hypothetical protein